VEPQYYPGPTGPDPQPASEDVGNRYIRTPERSPPAPGRPGGAAGTCGYAVGRSTGSGAVEAHLLWVQEVGGSNPPSPTSLIWDDTTL
jgi:hypothetical protein